jgi:hypothetical protein
MFKVLGIIGCLGKAATLFRAVRTWYEGVQLDDGMINLDDALELIQIVADVFGFDFDFDFDDILEEIDADDVL